MSLTITVHRGTHEVGGSCIEIATDSTRIILDVGMPLFDSERNFFDTSQIKDCTTDELLEQGVLPFVPGLFDDGSAPDAILISHAHQDHTGMLPYTNESIPVYCTSGTSKMMLAGSMFARQPGLPRDRHETIKAGEPVQIGDIQITGWNVDHSIYGSLAFVLEADGKSILYTGDLRSHGRKPGMLKQLLKESTKQNFDVLLVEGTHVGLAEGNSTTEKDLEPRMIELMKSTPGIVWASFSPQNVDRWVTFYRAAKQAGRIFVLDLYAAMVQHLVSSEMKIPKLGAEEDIKVYPLENQNHGSKKSWQAKQKKQLDRCRITLDELKANPEKYVMVSREWWLQEHAPVETLTDSTCIYSRWQGYLEQPTWQKTLELLKSHNGKLEVVHASGHIYINDLKEFITAVKPQQIVPIHTFEPDRFKEWHENVMVLEDGQVWAV